MIEGEETPKGALVAVGGNEEKEKDPRVLRTIIELPEGGTNIVEVIPTASSIPDEVADAYRDAFSKLGVKEVRVMDIRSREQAERKDYVKRIAECDVVFLTGGDQLRITSMIGGSPVARAIKRHYLNGGVVAGTSAGAAAMSETMIFEGESESSMKKGNVQMTPGLGLIRTAVIDTHFIHRGRVSRLIEVITSNPGLIGVGLAEDTGVIIRDGCRVEVIGNGVVVIVDGHKIRYTNISDVQMGEPIAVEHVILHTLVEGHGYDLDEQLYLPRDAKGKVNE